MLSSQEFCISTDGGEIFYKSTVCVDENSGAISKVQGDNTIYKMLDNSGTQFSGCSIDPSSTKVSANNTVIQVHRSFVCSSPQMSEDKSRRAKSTSEMKIVAVDTFTVDVQNNSIHWVMTASSPNTVAWSTDIVAALGYASWNTSARTQAWFGGPVAATLPSADPSTFFDPFAPIILPHDAADAATVSNITMKQAGWYTAANYNAVWGQLTNVSGKFIEVGSTATAEACQATCVKNVECKIYAWSDESEHCWWRLDNIWGSPETLKKEAGRVSGCLMGSNASTGVNLSNKPYVFDC